VPLPGIPAGDYFSTDYAVGSMEVLRDYDAVLEVSLEIVGRQLCLKHVPDRESGEVLARAALKSFARKSAAQKNTMGLLISFWPVAVLLVTFLINVSLVG
jgi:hypothetical protein